MDDEQILFLKKLRQQLVTLRHESSMTQEKLAEEAGIDRVALANIETGRRYPTVITLYKLSRALHTPLQNFFKSDA